eukprot:TRINITY_DN5255_c0_g3_i1.p2 TRINITY_DN5255_c0_g3~~TRINITY_DN5255_c0_g3_i1.p2  ORF type:complete len:451 (+),score=133.25 TRINITY_DN5255_c0_g3_i1:65-1354(+)
MHAQGTTGAAEQVQNLTRTTRCLIVLIGIMSFMLQVAMMKSDESWWRVCNKIPCWSEASVTEDVRGCEMTPQKLALIENAMPVALLAGRAEECRVNGQCDYDGICGKYKAHLFRQGYTLEESCLRQIKQADGSWVSFGEVCCSACGGGYNGDMENAFRLFATQKTGGVSCGVFTCDNNIFQLCPPRAEHVSATQAMMIIGVCFLGFTTLYHILELFAYDQTSVLPLPQTLRLVKGWLRKWAHLGHWVTGIINFVAATLLVATITRELCEERLVNYVDPQYGVRVMWVCVACQIFIGCMYYQHKLGWKLFAMYVKEGHVARHEANRTGTNRAIDLSSEPTNAPANGAQQAGSPARPAAATPARSENTPSATQAEHRMSPIEGEIDLDDERPQPAPLTVDAVQVDVGGSPEQERAPHPIQPPSQREPRLAS